MNSNLTTENKPIHMLVISYKYYAFPPSDRSTAVGDLEWKLVEFRKNS